VGIGVTGFGMEE